MTDIKDVIGGWREKLLDLSKRNRLINCRTGTKTGAVLLDHPEMRTIWATLVLNSGTMQFPWKHELLGEEDDEDRELFDPTLNAGAGRAVVPADDSDSKASKELKDAEDFEACLPLLGEHDVLTHLSDKLLGGRLRRLAMNAQSSLQEQGVHSLFVAFGLLRWYESKDSDEVLQAPLLLVPVNLSRSSLDSPWKLSVAEEEVVPNHCLVQLMLDSFNLKLPDASDDSLLETPAGLDQYLKQVRAVISSHPRWSVQDTVILGIFTFQKIAMWKDLGDNQERIASHPLCRMLANRTVEPMPDAPSVPKAHELDDRVHPAETYHILEADSSQHEAIEAAKRGLNLVLDGPPGTGKSQTIANIIAEFLAQGKSILFVSEKAAALEVVKRRLDAARLGDFCLECHSHKANKRHVVEELGRCLRLAPEPYEIHDGRFAELHRVRQQLNAYVRSLHLPKGKLGITPYQVHGRLAGLAPKSGSRCPIQEPLAVDAARLQMMQATLLRLTECSAIIANRGGHPWRGCTCAGHSLVVEDDIRHHLNSLSTFIPVYLAAFRDLEELGFIREHPSMSDLDQGFSLAREALTYPTIPSKWFEAPILPMAHAYLALNGLATTYQRIRSTLPHYVDAALDGDCEKWHRVLDANSAHLGCLRPSSAISIRAYSKRAETLLPELQKLISEAETLTHTMADVGEQMSCSEIARLSLDRIPQLCEMIELVTENGIWPIHRVAQGYLTLNELTSAYRRMRQTLPQYLDAALDFDWEKWTVSVSTPCIHLDYLSVSATGSIRANAKRCQLLHPELQKLVAAAQLVVNSAAHVADRLRSPNAARLPVHLLPKLCKVAELVAGAGQLQSSWFNTLRRQELLEVVEAGNREAKALAEERLQLDSLFVAGAFDDATEPVLVNAAHFRLFFRRLLPRWRTIRPQLAGLYISASPKSSSILLRDASRLLQYFRRRARLRDIGKSLGGEVRATNQGTVDWTAVLADIQLVGQIVATVRLPDLAKESLSSEDFDRDAFVVEAQELQESYHALTEALASFQQNSGIKANLQEDGVPSKNGTFTHDLSVWTDWLKDAERIVSERLTVIAQLVALLTSEGDVDFSECRRHAETLRNLRLKRNDLRIAYQTLKDVRVEDHCPENADWGNKAIIARRLLELAGAVLPESVTLPANSHVKIDSLKANTAKCRQNYSNMIQAMDRFRQRLGVEFSLKHGTVLHNEEPLASDLSTWTNWLTNAKGAVSEELAVLLEIVAVLAPDQDVEITECHEHISTLAKLKKNREELRSVYRSLANVGEEELCPENSEWTEKANLAQWISEFVGKHGASPPAPLVSAASIPTVRLRIRDAVNQIAALRTPDLLRSWQFICKVFPPNQSVSDGITLESTPVGQLIPWFVARKQDVSRIAEWSTFTEVSRDLEELGLTPLRDEVVEQTIPSIEVIEAFLVRFYRIWLDAAYAGDSGLSRFRVEDHEKLIGKFRDLDRQHIKDGSRRIRSLRLAESLGQSANSIDAPDSSELGILLREVNKQRRHLPLRQLFGHIPQLLRRIKPCMMMSPLAVSTYFDSGDLNFDVVVFDEASQVRPHDAVCAIYRGSQLVVAGDQKQLPPTSFFERQTDVLDEEPDEELDGLSDFESILDVCGTLQLPRKRLKWHYRSRRESLIAFSNEHFYDNELVTFPSVWDVDGGSAVGFEFVNGGRWQSGSSGGFNQKEAERTADLVLEHMRNMPGASLGVITMNQRQQVLVVEEIEKRRLANPELEEFFSDIRMEPFFVKNLENVQGDERDVIFLSIGYARDQEGTMAMRFGPLNIQGGERRLNVAVTRARQSLTLITSIRAMDIDLSRTNAIGAKLLRAYLDYAERGPEVLKAFIRDDGSRDADSPFELHVAKALQAQGLEIRRQVGCGRFRVDLAVVDPKQPGRYVLGVECDGATYHSSATARDRDRLRQSVLEEMMGWRMCRIWSTDWVRDPERQVKRVVAAYEYALQHPVSEITTSSNDEEAVEPKAPAPSRTSVVVPQHDFSNIEDVPEATIEQLILRILNVSGATERGELIVNVARRLGFDRTGNRISDRIGNMLRSMLRKGALSKGEDGRIRIGT